MEMQDLRRSLLDQEDQRSPVRPGPEHFSVTLQKEIRKIVPTEYFPPFHPKLCELDRRRKDLILADAKKDIARINYRENNISFCSKLDMQEPIESFAVLPYSGSLLLGGPLSLYHYDFETQGLKKLHTFNHSIKSIAVSRDDQLAYVLLMNFNIMKLTVGAPERPRELFSHRSEANCLNLSPDDTLLFSTGRDMCVYVYDTQKDEQLPSLRIEGVGLCLASTNGFLGCGTNSGKVYLWKYHDNEEPYCVWSDTTEALCYSCIDIDYARVAVGDTNGCLTIWNIRDPNIIPIIKRGSDKTFSIVKFSNSTKSLFYGTKFGNSIKKWRLPEFSPEVDYKLNEDTLIDWTYSPELNLMIVSYGEGGITITDLTSGESQQLLMGLTGIKLHLCPDGKFVLVKATGEVLYILNLQNKETRIALNNSRDISKMLISKNWRYLVIGNLNGTVCFYD